MKPVVLRLDSGALIGTPSALGISSTEPIVRLSAEEAAKIGRLDYRQVLHARKLLKQAANELGYDLKKCPELETDEEMDEESPQVESEATADDMQMKVDEGGENYLASPRGHEGSIGSQSPEGSSQRLEFYDKCSKILEDTIHELGKDASIFMAPVDPREVPDYFTVVKKPMDLGTIQKRLEEGFYESSRDFAEDVRLVWSNCSLYNKKGEYIAKIGQRGSMCFENLWAMSGLAEEHRLKRMRRPAQKYEPEENLATDTPTKKSNKAPGRNPKARKPNTKTGKGEGDGDASQADKSENREMTDEEKQNLASRLSSLSDGTMPETQQALAMLEDVVKIIQDCSNIDMKKNGGEIELDISELDNRTLWKLDAYLKEHKVEPTAEGGVVVNMGSSSDTSSSSFGDSDSDSDGVHEE